MSQRSTPTRAFRGKKLASSHLSLADPVRCDVDYAAVMAKARGLVRERAANLMSEKLTAAALLEQLLEKDAKGRRLWVENSPRFRSWVLGNRLLRRCEKEWLSSPKAAEELADLADRIAQRLDPSAYSFGMILDLRALAKAYVANCQRIQGELAKAEASLRTAFELVEAGTGDQQLEARILSLQAILDGAFKRFPKAIASIEKVESLYRRTGDRHRVAHTLISRAKLLIDSGAPTQAEWALHRAQRLIHPSEELRLVLFLRHNLVCCAVAMGDLDRAKGLMSSSEPLYRQFQEPALDNNRLRLEELIQQNSGEGARFEAPAQQPLVQARGLPPGASPFLALAAEDDGRVSRGHFSSERHFSSHSKGLREKSSSSKAVDRTG